MLVAHRVVGVTQRIADFDHVTGTAVSRRHDAQRHVGQHRLDRVIDRHLDLRHQRPQRRIEHCLRTERGYVKRSIDERARQDIGQTMIGGLARARIPFLRLADDLEPGKF